MIEFMSAPLQAGYYYIQQVSEITGISKQLIRKWEDRYQLVIPSRLENGYRIYTDNDINLLLTVKELIDQGQSVKQVATLIHKGEIKIKNESNKHLHLNVDRTNNVYVIKLLQEGAACKEAEMYETLQQAYFQLGLDRFLKDVIVPFLKDVGLKWEKGDWNEYQEAFSSILIRDFLIEIRRNFRINENAPLVVGACLPNEQHELPILITLLFTMLKGWRTFLVGTSPAPHSIESIVKQLQPKIVLLSATTSIPLQDDQLLKQLDTFAGSHKETTFYIGGEGSIQHLKNKQLQHIIVTNRLEDAL